MRTRATRTKTWRQGSLAISLLFGALLATGKASATPIQINSSKTPDHCITAKVIKIDFGDVVGFHHSLALSPSHQQGRQVFLALNNGMELEIDENIGDTTFYDNYGINHSVEVCPKRNNPGLPFTITDHNTGSFADAKPNHHRWPQP